MKIYTRVVIDIDSSEVIEEDSFEYDGPLAMAWGGDGAEGGRGVGSDGIGGSGDSGSDGHGGDSSGGSNGGEGGDQGGGDANSDGRPGGGDTSGMGTDSSYGGAGDFGGGDSSVTSQSGWGKIASAVSNIGKTVAGIGVVTGNPGLVAAGTAATVAGTGMKLGESAVNAISGMDFSGMAAGSSSGAVSGEAGSNGGENSGVSTSGKPGSADVAMGATSEEAMAKLLKALGIEKVLPSINDQFYNLFQGADPPYSIADQMAGYTGQQEETKSEWDAFESKYNEAGQSVLDAYDSLSKGHADSLNMIPQANLILPKSMGGDTMQLAPGKWVNTINAAANAQNDILKSKAAAIPSLAGVQASAIAGRNQAGSNQYLTPLNTSFDIFAGDKGYANQQSMLDKQLEANEPSTSDKWLSGILAGSKIYSDNSEAINSGVSSLWDWIAGS